MVTKVDYTEEIRAAFDQGADYARTKISRLAANATQFAKDCVSLEGPRIAIVCPTSEELSALIHVMSTKKDDVLEKESEHPLKGIIRESTITYYRAVIDSSAKGRLDVVLCCARDQGVAATSYAVTAMLKDYPLVEHVVLCGVSAGVPHPLPLNSDPSFSRLQKHEKEKYVSDCEENNLRLGDIAIGVSAFQFDFGKITRRGFARRDLPRRACPKLLDVCEDLYRERKKRQPWQKYLTSALRRQGIQRPKPASDKVYDWEIVTKEGEIAEIQGQLRNKPGRMSSDPKNGPNIRKVNVGTSNAVIKDPSIRQFLWDHHRVGAIEMEGAAAADAVVRSGAQFLIIRGISDYSSPDKNDAWWMYAATAAASFARCVVEDLS